MSYNTTGILDNFLPAPYEYRNSALLETFSEVRGPDGELYTGISVHQPSEIEGLLCEKLQAPVTVDFFFLRLNPKGEVHRIHTDNAYSTFAFILYLNPTEQCLGGTAFWSHKKYGWAAYPDESSIRKIGKSPKRVCSELLKDGDDALKWNQLCVVDMKFNRLVFYPCGQFHSRWPLEGFGRGKNDSRLIGVGFFRRK